MNNVVGRLFSVILLTASVNYASAAIIDGLFIPANDGSTATNGRILEFNAQTGVYVDSVISNLGSSQIQGMTMGLDGYLYISAFNTQTNIDGRVLRVDPISGAVNTFVSPGSGGLFSPAGLTFGADGKLYVLNNSSSGNNYTKGSVLRYDGTTGLFLDVFSSSLAVPQDMAFGPDGDLYVTNGFGDSIGRYDGITGAFSGFLVSPGVFGLDAPVGMAFGVTDDLYVASFPTNSIFRIDISDGSLVNKFILPTLNGYDTLLDVAFGPDGSLFASMRGVGTAIYRLDPDSGVILDQFATLPGPLGFNTGMLFIDSACSRYGSLAGGASGCFVTSSVPEPGAISLIAAGLVGLIALRRQQRCSALRHVRAGGNSNRMFN